MDTKLQPFPTDPGGRTLSVEEWNDPRIAAAHAGVPVEMMTGLTPTAAELVAMYGTDKPDELRRIPFVLDVDIAAAERLAASMGAAA
ncbi:hypothetical protein ABZ671_00435 [Micromonospora sp. NPDC006766]|uniref:hypothetical protein n=1 Tax=Micromonospora sp. NPDC006766 TaxID=3154778 RepID=UPI0033EC33CB